MCGSSHCFLAFPIIDRWAYRYTPICFAYIHATVTIRGLIYTCQQVTVNLVTTPKKVSAEAVCEVVRVPRHSYHRGRGTYSRRTILDIGRLHAKVADAYQQFTYILTEKKTLNKSPIDAAKLITKLDRGKGKESKRTRYIPNGIPGRFLFIQRRISIAYVCMYVKRDTGPHTEPT
ncbi:uncharacterized protein H6S33_005234 [Morchella sextelata]|uniref:uncharacterized protein n=1 Tax=Morchella sextelata TaxID=1174677 RepID=UPI001D04D9F3|nr:uncharacterized protein H6S33_005234 [Morchella sextelata]KAH0605252.1 hypothetical protein H6S33_005234 [Morchella sextelata]